MYESECPHKYANLKHSLKIIDIITDKKVLVLCLICAEKMVLKLKQLPSDLRADLR